MAHGHIEPDCIVKILNIGADNSGQSLQTHQELSDQDLHCVPFPLHLLSTLLSCKTSLVKFQYIYMYAGLFMSNGGVPSFHDFQVFILILLPTFVLLMWQHVSHDTISSLFMFDFTRNIASGLSSIDDLLIFSLIYGKISVFLIVHIKN